MTFAMPYEVYFRRPNDAVVFAETAEVKEVSLLHRNADGAWHCALCDATECRHAAAAEAAHGDRTASA